MTPKENLKFLIHAYTQFYVKYPEGASKKWHEERAVKSEGFLHAIITLAEVTLNKEELKNLKSNLNYEIKVKEKPKSKKPFFFADDKAKKEFEEAGKIYQKAMDESILKLLNIKKENND